MLQVSIEQAFSTLRLVLTHIRNRLDQENILLVKLNLSFLDITHYVFFKAARTRNKFLKDIKEIIMLCYILIGDTTKTVLFNYCFCINYCINVISIKIKKKKKKI